MTSHHATSTPGRAEGRSSSAGPPHIASGKPSARLAGHTKRAGTSHQVRGRKANSTDPAGKSGAFLLLSLQTPSAKSFLRHQKVATLAGPQHSLTCRLLLRSIPSPLQSPSPTRTAPTAPPKQKTGGTVPGAVADDSFRSNSIPLRKTAKTGTDPSAANPVLPPETLLRRWPPVRPTDLRRTQYWPHLWPVRPARLGCRRLPDRPPGRLSGRARSV